MGFETIHLLSHLMYCGIDNTHHLYENSPTLGFFGFLWCLLTILFSILYLTSKKSRKEISILTFLLSFLVIFSAMIGKRGLISPIIAMILYIGSKVYSES